MRTGLFLNGVTVFEKGQAETWSSAMLNQRVLQNFGDELVKDILIYRLEHSTETMNEFLTAVIQRDTPETGYEKFYLRNFKGLETPLEESVIQRVTQKLTQVKNFSVACMWALVVKVRCQFVDFAADVIELNESQMTDINFEGIIYDNQITGSDQRLIEVLCNSEQN